MNDSASTPAAQKSFQPAAIRSFVLARLRAYGPSFDFDLQTECFAPDPHAVVEELRRSGYHIEALRTYRKDCEGSMAWGTLFVMRVKHARTGEVRPTPVSVGDGPFLEVWPENEKWT